MYIEYAMPRTFKVRLNEEKLCIFKEYKDVIKSVALFSEAQYINPCY